MSSYVYCTVIYITDMYYYCYSCCSPYDQIPRQLPAHSTYTNTVIIPH